LKKNILITGASGQLGQFFVEKLAENNNVISSDVNVSSELVKKYDLKFLDASNEIKVRKFIDKYHIEEIYNFASILSAKAEKYPLKSFQLNTNCFLNVIKASTSSSVKKIFWPSSIAVFSKESNLDYVRQDVIMNPTTIYGASKLACEKVINYFNVNGLLDIRSIRFPGIVSSSSPGGGTTDYIVEMINNIKSKKKYICPISPNILLPMMHVSDAVDASVKLMSVPRNNININDSYNISSFETTPNEWKNLICELGYNLEVDFQPDFRQKIADSWPRKIDDKQIRKDLNWKPKFNKIKTLKSVIENYNLT
tara:strand:+ start:5621 stop:6550 length:930 start_codon:yes stop_codon:yes gene_type:complete